MIRIPWERLSYCAETVPEAKLDGHSTKTRKNEEIMRSYGDTDQHSPVGPYGNVLSQTLKVRDTRIVALKSDIESGHYSVEAEQVAEKIMKNLLLALFHY